MKDMIARLATHQTTPISTCNRNDHDEDTFYEDNLDDYDGSYDEDGGDNEDKGDDKW